MKSCIFDIETNGLDDKLDRVHCMVIMDTNTKEVSVFEPFTMDLGLKKLEEFDRLVGHNIISFDLPALNKVFQWKPLDKQKFHDTLILSRLIYPNRASIDSDNKAIEPHLYGRHSLESWGQRLGFKKGTFGVDQKVFRTNSIDMMDYCRRDVELTYKLYCKLLRAGFSEKSIDMEHEIHKVCQKQTEDGFPFDAEKGARLYAVLSSMRQKHNTKLKKVFGSWEEEGETWTPKVNNKKLGYTKGVPVTRVKTVEFNPNSRQHIAKRLKDIHGWNPIEFTPSGEAKIDETILSKLPYPEAKLMAEAFRVNKLIAQLSEGKHAWLDLEKKGRLHGSVNTMGSISSRCSHTHPNLGQVPSVKAPFGKECRELFYAPSGYSLVGCDVASLEIRVVGHYMAKYDGGVFANTCVEGDIHETNRKATGLATRDQAKTFIYGLLYGAGDAKLGQIVGQGPEEGARLKTTFFTNNPAFKKFRDDVYKSAKKGYLIGLDGRKVPIRAIHSSVNSLCQSAGAIICKRWVVEFHKLMEKSGYLNTSHWQHNGVDYQQVAFVHDEIQVLVKKGLEDEIGKKAVDAITLTGVLYDLRVPLTGEYKIGRTWADTH